MKQKLIKFINEYSDLSEFSISCIMLAAELAVALLIASAYAFILNLNQLAFDMSACALKTLMLSTSVALIADLAYKRCKTDDDT